MKIYKTLIAVIVVLVFSVNCVYAAPTSTWNRQYKRMESGVDTGFNAGQRTQNYVDTTYEILLRRRGLPRRPFSVVVWGRSPAKLGTAYKVYWKPEGKELVTSYQWDFSPWCEKRYQYNAETGMLRIGGRSGGKDYKPGDPEYAEKKQELVGVLRDGRALARSPDGEVTEGYAVNFSRAIRIVQNTP